ncbi:hypothetical protein NONO_c17670 [Nocardia nova SH22a]|uniref:Uncharacterized protein n=1 Tax=Nocardia nova SH22a TaxID=1415166 RepID=W5TBI3_9NOCA|nr:hypothetical protein [Nocardia nova]AHH16567.1 hypothetical protein NONO_c17670 [Nocardia nova SH22a]
MPEFPDITNLIRDALERDGLLPAPINREPTRSVPVRYWPNPDMAVTGYLDIYTGDTNDLTFRAAPLHGQKPVYDLRVKAQEAGR